jgi:NADH dehydrogenase
MPQEPKTRVVILGGGFAGVFAAKALKKRAPPDIAVELINETNYFVFQPLLPEVAAGGITVSDAVTPLRLLLPNVKVHRAELIGFDVVAKTVSVVRGRKRRLTTVPYDHLVLALGQTVDLSDIPGMTEHALTMKDLSDAFHLRNHVIDCLEHADTTADPDLKRELLTFVVVGAGFSGVETVGEVKDMIDHSLQFYSNVRPDEVRVLLIEFAPRILRELPENLGRYAATQLAKRGIELLLETGVKSATGSAVETSDGRIHATRTIIATVGHAPWPLVLDSPFETLRGKIKVDRFLRVAGQKKVWALGDMALIPLKDQAEDPSDYAPPTAQFAVREARSGLRY